MATAQEVKRYRHHLADDALDSAAAYDTLAQPEHDVERSQIFGALAASEREHANVWREKLTANGVRLRPYRRSAKIAVVGVFTSLFNGRSAAFSALRQVAIGPIGTAFTAGAGRLPGVSIS